jgi:catechol 2,3-dioxygenase
MTFHTTLLQSHQTPYHIETVTLQVHDLARVSRFYQNVMGLAVLSANSEAHQLGCDDQVLVRLVSNPAASVRAPRTPGLFHTAFLVPERRDLGRWLHHAIASEISIDGMADHGVSEAIYLADPEGNGIEIYVDRPRKDWRVVDGQVQMGNARIDIEGLLAPEDAPSAAVFRLASGSRIGHIHLDVPALADADTFLQGIWGMDRMFALQGAHFFSNGGYHHHIAANIWNARGRSAPAGEVRGLSYVEIRANNTLAHQALLARWAQSPGFSEHHPDAIIAPWGLRFQLMQD